MIYGIGVDIVKIERIKNAGDKWGRKFFDKILTDDEISYCYKKQDPNPSLAVRFAAKEALIKAIGSEIPVNMKEVEVVHKEKGKPSLEVKGKVRSFFQNKEIKSCHLSLSHEKEFGVAFVILES
jgi:holo-[acyl-carrier protein] synthase